MVRTLETHSSSGRSPEIRPASAVMIGASTSARASARDSSGTRSSASTAWPMRSGISPAGTPSASSSPARRLRDCGASAVPTRSPVPASPIRDSGRAPWRSAKRQTSRKTWPAAAPAALRPWDSVADAASAAAFLAAPASSTPIGSSDISATTPARPKTSATDRVSAGSAPATTSAAPSVTISRAWAGPPTQATRAAPSYCASSTVGAMPWGGTRPLASEITGVRARSPARAQPGDDRLEAAGRHAQEDEVGAGDAGRYRLHAQLGRQLDAGEVDAVLAVGLQALGLLGGAGLERGPEAAAREQHRDGGAERSGADDDGAAGARGGEAELWPRGHRDRYPATAVGSRPQPCLLLFSEPSNTVP